MEAKEQLHHRKIAVLPPQDEAIPEFLVGSGAQAVDVREARVEGQLVGAYRIERVRATHFRLLAIEVLAPWQHRGIGTWLLRHAIGLAESRGARTIDAPTVANAFFEHSGFEHTNKQMRLTLRPE